MRELIDDPLYEILDEYDRLEIDYCLIENDAPYCGLLSHRDAVVFAMNRLRECYPWITFDADTLSARNTTVQKLLNFPDEPWKEEHAGTTVYHTAFTNGSSIPYWYAFLEPPHGTGPVVQDGLLLRREYGREDFDIVNRALFPEGTEELTVYEWSTDWSNYFDAGHEWWGTLCYSVYDAKLNRYAIILASSTD